MRAALIALTVLCALAAAGCGSARKGTAKQATTRQAAPPTGLRVGVVGPLDVAPVAGAWLVRGPLETMPAYPLVVVSAEAAGATTLATSAAAHPSSHFALVGASSAGLRRRNVLGLVLDDDQAAVLGGVVAGLVAADQGERIAWVGPQERSLAASFTRGAQGVLPGVTVLRAWSADLPAACKEAALGAIARGAVAVMAHGGACADAAIAGAHQQNLVGLRLADFEFPEVPVGIVIRDAVAGVYRGGEDIVFGAASGAIGIRRLDPRISPDVSLRARAAAQQLASGLRPSG